ncbi:hypothetical protein V498_08196 [Pseudogymnoascus sp. VKM F-4517 (FW-2822)]|nr:hypothetical protein V498_08196 [Pseudogymnoascus sp. VKM F-4517 (FW-2822)]
MELARMEHQPKDIVSLIEHTVRIDNRMYEFQREKRVHDGPKRYNKYQRNEGRKRDHHPRDNRWSDTMELDATFKPGKPRDPKKDRQFKERLCFNCDKPGHMAQDCRQPKKGNGGMQLNATFVNQQDWGISGTSTSEEESSDEESDTESLTPSKRETFNDLAPQCTINDRCADLVNTMTKFAHKKIKEAKSEPKGERNVAIIRSVYKTALEKLPRQVLAEDRRDDLWTYYNRINDERQERGTSTAVMRLEDQQEEWLRKEIKLMAKQESLETVEQYYQDRKQDLKHYA